MLTKTLSRRHFLATSGVAATGVMVSAALPGLAYADSSMIKPAKKALVFVMLDGGNDSFNMLVPNDGIAYQEYARTRGNLALGNGDLIALEGTDAHGQSFGLHRAAPELAQLYNRGKLSFVANVGPLVEKVTKAQFYDGSAKPCGPVQTMANLAPGCPAKRRLVRLFRR